MLHWDLAVIWLLTSDYLAPLQMIVWRKGIYFHAVGDVFSTIYLHHGRNSLNSGCFWGIRKQFEHNCCKPLYFLGRFFWNVTRLWNDTMIWNDINNILRYKVCNDFWTKCCDDCHFCGISEEMAWKEANRLWYTTNYLISAQKTQFVKLSPG